MTSRNTCPAQHTPSYRAEKHLPHRGATGPWAEAYAILIEFVVRASASRPKAAKVMELALLAAAACPFLARAAAAAAALLLLEIFNTTFGRLAVPKRLLLCLCHRCGRARKPCFGAKAGAGGTPPAV